MRSCRRSAAGAAPTSRAAVAAGMAEAAAAIGVEAAPVSDDDVLVDGAGTERRGRASGLMTAAGDDGDGALAVREKALVAAGTAAAVRVVGAARAGVVPASGAQKSHALHLQNSQS